jgi:hypothetical protein
VISASAWENVSALGGTRTPTFRSVVSCRMSGHSDGVRFRRSGSTGFPVITHESSAVQLVCERPVRGRSVRRTLVSFYHIGSCLDNLPEWAVGRYVVDATALIWTFLLSIPRRTRRPSSSATALWRITSRGASDWKKRTLSCRTIQSANLSLHGRPKSSFPTSFASNGVSPTVRSLSTI